MLVPVPSARVDIVPWSAKTLMSPAALMPECGSGPPEGGASDCALEMIECLVRFEWASDPAGIGTAGVWRARLWGRGSGAVGVAGGVTSAWPLAIEIAPAESTLAFW